jgi:hypothetical protein
MRSLPMYILCIMYIMYTCYRQMSFLRTLCVQVQVNLVDGGERTYVQRMVPTCSSVGVYNNVYNDLYVSCQDSAVNLIIIITIYYYTYYNTIIVVYEI